jgi:hypothetical protein
MTVQTSGQVQELDSTVRRPGLHGPGGWIPQSGRLDSREPALKASTPVDLAGVISFLGPGRGW